ncbi:hypothetical protein ACFVSW_20280 [Neobacillus sp. NPDC058068]|uniref:hypothetical protein n=1 Tax=Neobacillus sp. NPDC058068 TaxID=3346325 RepID=UPI0036D89664
MSTDIREIVKRHVEEESLKGFLAENYDLTDATEKQKILDFAKEMTDRKVKNILDTFLEDIMRGSPERKRKRIFKLFSAIITLLSSGGLAHAINLENVGYATICGSMLLIVQIFAIFNE